jgi:hypothetical protein
MPTLNLGVIELPYDDGGKRPPARKVPKKPRNSKKAPPTRKTDESPTDTVFVATILEENYGLMGIFYESNEDQITAELINSLEGSLENLYAGAPVGNPFAEADAGITQAFKVWLSSGIVEQLGIPGVPTQAAIDRRSLRFKSKKASGPRPSFIDTGTFERSFLAWTEQ